MNANVRMLDKWPLISCFVKFNPTSLATLKLYSLARAYFLLRHQPRIIENAITYQLHPPLDLSYQQQGQSG